MNLSGRGRGASQKEKDGWTTGGAGSYHHLLLQNDIKSKTDFLVLFRKVTLWLIDARRFINYASPFEHALGSEDDILDHRHNCKACMYNHYNNADELRAILI